MADRGGAERDGARDEVAGDDVGRTIEVYRGLLLRYHRTLDLMSERGLDGLDGKLADARAYAAAVQAWAGSGSVIDVGSGAGLPGLVVAAADRERHVLWVERRRRRATFLTMVAAACGLERVRVVADDVRVLEREALPAPLAAVTAQAVAAFADVYGWTRHLHGERVVMVARRGATWAEEVAVLAERIGAEPRVLATETLERGGTLVVLSAPGGSSCR